MTLQECYAAMGADYQDAIGRLRSERLVKKFVLRFLDDHSFETLCRAVEAQDREEAFRASHTIKGICLNLGIAPLAASSSELTEALREHWAPEAPELLEKVKADYARTFSAIQALAAEGN